ncbi:MAG: deoxyribonuclease V [Chloroflexi bacterium]|nr:deoxyribonuclease V [Chloroflexota bacterium]
MQLPAMPRWDVVPAEAMRIQHDLAARVIERDAVDEARLLAGVDVGFEGEGNRIARAAVVVLRATDLAPVDYAIARVPVAFPYIPGLLAFRELPVIWRALAELQTTPDVIVVDGQGRAHPRRLGIASHLGVLLDVPTIGCAKSILCGKADAPQEARGAWSPLVDRGETIGAALRTRVGASPVYVSVGHRVTLPRAIELVLQCCKSYRLPETTRWAHRVAGGEPIVVQTQERLL